MGRLKAGWQEVVELQRQGKAISIGVSNFTLAQMKELLEGEKPVEVTPAVNQIEMHPYIWHDIKDNVKYCLANVSRSGLSLTSNRDTSKIRD